MEEGKTVAWAIVSKKSNNFVRWNEINGMFLVFSSREVAEIAMKKLKPLRFFTWSDRWKIVKVYLTPLADEE